MKQYFGNYLGLCVNNDDPQKRGRVQIFIPHIMPGLYENWNEVGEDIQMLCVGDNLPSSLTSSTVEKLTKMLPWSESASPIIGTSAPGNIISNPAGGSFYNQSGDAVASGTNAAINNLNGLLSDSTRYAGGDSRGAEVKSTLFGARGGQNCGRGTVAVLGALTNNTAFQGGSAGGNAWDYALGGTAPSNVFANSGIYRGRQPLPSNYLNDRSQWQIGDVVAVATPNRNSGHIQVWTGSAWVSDFVQSGNILTKGYDFSTGALHRLTPQGLAQTTTNVQQKYGGILTGEVSGGEGNESTSVGGTVAATSPQSTETPINENPDENNYGNVARPEVTSSSGSGLGSGVSNGVKGLIAAIGKGESDFSNSYLARNKDSYNQVGNNANVRREFNRNGGNLTAAQAAYGDYGYFQNNDATEGAAVYNYLKGQGFSESDANYYRQAITNNRGNGNFSVTDQSQAMVYLLNAKFPDAVAQLNNLNANDPNFTEQIRSIASQARIGGIEGRTAKWFGLDEGLDSGAANPTSSQFAAVSEGNLNTLAGQGLVNHPDPNGPTAVMNLNNMAKGVFSYPAAGSLLWVFFREGDPNFPVYFAASFGASEWQSAYRQGSDVAGYQPAARPESPVTSTGGNMNLGGVGGIRWEDTNAGPTDPTKDQKSIMLYSYDGSNMFFNEGYHQIFSKFDRRDQVEGDRFESTLGFKEEWVQGDSNEVVMGDVYVKVGNVSKPALDAVTRIQEIIKEIMQPLAESKSGSSGGSSKPPSNFTKDAEKNAPIKDTGPWPTPVGEASTVPGQFDLNELTDVSNRVVGAAGNAAQGAFNAGVNAANTIASQPSNNPGGAGSSDALGSDFPGGGF